MPRQQKQRKGMGYLYKRDAAGKEVPATSKKHGTFWLAYRDATGKRVRVKIEKDGKPVTDLETARKEQARLRSPVITGNQVEVLKATLDTLEKRQEVEQDAANPPLSIAGAWAAYENATNRPECGEATMATYRSSWGRFVAWMAAEYQDAKPVFLRDVTEEIAGAYMAHLRTLDWTPNTYNKALGLFRLMFRVLKKQARMTVNPFDDITRRKLTTNSRRELTIEELHRVITAATGEKRLLFEIGMFTGLRLGDCCTLRWREVDLVREIIKRRPNKTLHSSGAEVTIGIPKVFLRKLAAIPEAERGEYVLPGYAARYMSSRNAQGYICREIQRHFMECGIEVHAKGTGSKSHYVGKRKVYEPTKRAVVEVGFHSLRHTYASIHAREGTPQALIQENLGHSNPAMTEHYQHVSDETARRAAAAMDFLAVVEDEADPDGLAVMRERLQRIIQSADGALLQRLLQAAGPEPVLQ